MPDDVKISEMSEAASLDNSAQFPYVQSMNGNLTTLKAPLSQIGTKINEGMTFSNLQTTSKTIVGAINEAAQGGGASYATELPISSTDPTDTKSYIDNKTTLVKSASGDLITISDGGDNIPLKSCEVTINPDLSGKTECNLVVCGKNLVNWKVSPTSNALSVSFKPNTYTISAQSTLSDGNWYMRFTKNDNSFISDSSIVSLTGWNYASSGWFYGGPQTQSKTFIIPNDCVLFECGKLNSDGTIYAQIEVGNQATAYEQYNVTTYNIPFGQTVTAGGTLDVISGELVVGGVTTQLTPVSPKTISGINNIYNDCGATDIEYFTSSADGLAALIEVLSNS